MKSSRTQKIRMHWTSRRDRPKIFVLVGSTSRGGLISRATADSGCHPCKPRMAVDMNVSVTVAMLYHPQCSEWVKQACKWRADGGCRDAPQKVQCWISLSAISWKACWIVQFAWCRASDIRDSSERQSWSSHGTGRAVNLSGQCQRQEKECAFSHTKHASRLRSSTPALLDNHALPARFQQRLAHPPLALLQHHTSSTTASEFRVRQSSDSRPFLLPPLLLLLALPTARRCRNPLATSGHASAASRPPTTAHIAHIIGAAPVFTSPHFTCQQTATVGISYHTPLTA